MLLYFVYSIACYNPATSCCMIINTFLLLYRVRAGTLNLTTLLTLFDMWSGPFKPKMVNLHTFNYGDFTVLLRMRNSYKSFNHINQTVCPAVIGSLCYDANN